MAQLVKPHHLQQGVKRLWKLCLHCVRFTGRFWWWFWWLQPCRPTSQRQQATNSLETSYWRYRTERLTHWFCHTSDVAERSGRGSKQQQDGHRLGQHHDKTLRASVSILSSSFTPSSPPWIFSGLSSTSTLLVYGSNLTEKGRLMPATYPLVKDIKGSEN